MTSYDQRKTGALQGTTVHRRDDPTIAQYVASDQWNRHHYPSHWSERPIHLGMYAPFGKPQVQSAYHMIDGGSAPRANREFGLMWIPLKDRALERAPDQAQHPMTNLGNIGRFL